LKKLYEVRVRVDVGGGIQQKKSKFYWLSKPSEASKVYKGPGHIMTVEKVGKERLLGVGTFFTLGNDLLREFEIVKEIDKGGDALENVLGKATEKEKIIKRRYNARQRKEASY